MGCEEGCVNEIKHFLETVVYSSLLGCFSTQCPLIFLTQQQTNRCSLRLLSYGRMNGDRLDFPHFLHNCEMDVFHKSLFDRVLFVTFLLFFSFLIPLRECEAYYSFLLNDQIHLMYHRHPVLQVPPPSPAAAHTRIIFRTFHVMDFFHPLFISALGYSPPCHPSTHIPFLSEGNGCKY